MGLYSSLLLGLLASVHCAGMCSGVQGALNYINSASNSGEQVVRSAQQIQLHLLLLNLGRICMYGILGTVLVYLTLQAIIVIDPSDATRLAKLARWFVGVLFLLIGLQLLLPRFRPLTLLEKPGYKLWRVISPLFALKNTNSLFASFRKGLLWGLLPCGLIYSVLLANAANQSVSHGALNMMAFGAGTMPALLLSGNALMGLQRFLRSQYTQTAGGLLFILFGLMTFFAPWLINHSAIKSNPLFYNIVRCF